MNELISVTYFVALLCAQSTGGSCGYPDIYGQLFWKESECWAWIERNAQKYARKDCKEVRLTLKEGRPVQ